MMQGNTKLAGTQIQATALHEKKNEQHVGLHDLL